MSKVIRALSKIMQRPAPSPSERCIVRTTVRRINSSVGRNFPVEECTRRANLKGLGFLQIFLGFFSLLLTLTVVPYPIVNDIDLSYSRIWSGVLNVALGGLAVYCARFSIERPARNSLITCIILNLILAVASVIAFVLVLIYAQYDVTNLLIACTDPEDKSRCAERATVLLLLLMRLATISLCVGAATVAVAIRKADVSITDKCAFQNGEGSEGQEAEPLATVTFDAVPPVAPSYARPMSGSRFTPAMSRQVASSA
ncbi:hypothetical protein RvY_03476 [Ramazzottius varieornatus]|uniref:MARVEL domain-containing protein n=1 Tax=Ramazzottius varieornatus TaxID=947166 RepID=A0A1D1UV90_RAMVA|nr:hypothetical protein RvY_03476 [Ramazzottius varieornatus]